MEKDIYTKKLALRKLCRETRGKIHGDLKAQYDKSICEQIISLPEFCSASVLLAYYPIGSEIDILPIIKEAYTSGMRVAFPVCNSDSEMVFRYCNSIDELKKGMYSIPEPSKSAELYTPFENTFCIVPALAIDKCGYRLGYGKGYYDRFLSGFCGNYAAVIYDELFLDFVAHDEHDIKISTVISQGGRRKIKDEIL